MGSRADGQGPIIVALEGPSGAGKTTLSRSLWVEMDAPLIQEAYDRLQPTPSLGFTNPRELLRLEKMLLKEEARRYGEATAASSEGRSVVMDTGPLGPVQYLAGLVVAGWPVKGALAQLIREARGLVRGGRLGLVDLEVYVDVPPRGAFGRSQRRSPRGETEFLERHYTVDRALRPLWQGPWKKSLDARLAFVPGGGSAAEVAKRIHRSVRLHARARGPIESASLAFLRSVLTVRPPGSSGNR